MKQILILLSLALPLFFYSCSADELLCCSSAECEVALDSIDEELLSTDFDYAKSVLREFISLYPEIYGEQIFVFPDLATQENEIQVINSMDYSTLRSWQQANGLMHNDIINSIIIHDSIRTDIFESYGLSSFPNIAPEAQDENVFEWAADQEEKEDMAYDEYDRIMRSNYSQFVKKILEEDGTIVYEPLGILDENVLYNKEGVYICEGIIFKKLEDGILTCEYFNYPKFKDCKTCEEVENSPHKNLAQITQYPQNSTSDLIRFHKFVDPEYYKNPKYRLSVRFQVRVTGFWFGSEIHQVTMIAENQHRCKDGSYRKVACETKIKAPVATSCPWTDEWKVRFNTGWCPMTPGMIYYREKIFRCGCSKTHFTQIEIDAKNQHGVIIKNNLKFSSL